MHVVTHAWIMNHQSRRNGWTADQLFALGIAWPPAKGWMHGVLGKTISDQAKARFEMAMRAKAARGTETLDLFG